MVWSKWYHCQCSGDGKRQGKYGHPVEWHSVEIDLGYVSSRTLWIKFTYLRVKVCVENGRRVVEFCAEKGMCVGKIYFEHNEFA